MIGIFSAENIEFGDGTVKATVPQISIFAIKQIIDQLEPDKTYKITVDEYKSKRSLSQNAFLWVLCNEIAKKISTTKEEVYKDYIKSVGLFDVVRVPPNTKEQFVTRWNAKGVGWFADILDDEEEYAEIIVYYGSSIYSTEELNRVLDEVIADCKEFSINTDIRNYGGR